MVERALRPLIEHLAARAMSVNDPEVLWDEVVRSSYEFEMQKCPSAEAFAIDLLAAQDDQFWEVDGLAADWVVTEITGSYLDHLNVERNIESHERYLSGDPVRLDILVEAGRIALYLLNPKYEV